MMSYHIELDDAPRSELVAALRALADTLDVRVDGLTRPLLIIDSAGRAIGVAQAGESE